MAKGVLQDRAAMIIGIECAPGRAAAQQFSRAGCRVVLVSQDSLKLDQLLDQLIKKGGDPTALLLSHNEEKWEEQMRMARDRLGHIHIVVNAMAFCYAGNDEADAKAELATRLDQMAAELLISHGPTKLLTLWPKDRELPQPVSPTAWHGMVVLGPRQRLDTESIPELDAQGTMVLRAGAVADTLVFLAQMPPSAKPARIELGAIPSSEKKPK